MYFSLACLHAFPGLSLLIVAFIVLIYTGVWQWIESMRKQVCDLEHCVRLAKGNVEQISTIMMGWSLTPLYLRKEDKRECLLGLEVVYCNSLNQ